ncbi:MAG: NDP-sugar synthase [Candidatus Nealsonbacteria bacterium]
MCFAKEVAAIVLAGGKGVRFREIIGDKMQKVLFKVQGKPLIQYTTELLTSNSCVKRIVFNLGHRGEDVQKWVLSQSFLQKICFSFQTEWTIYNAISKALEYIPEQTVICCNGDEIRLSLCIKEALNFHWKNNNFATMIGSYKNHLNRYRLLHLDSQSGLLLASELKAQRFQTNSLKVGLINAGIIIFEKEFAKYFLNDPNNANWSAIIDPLCERKMLSVYVDQNLTYFNIGTKEELEEVLNSLNI